MKHLFFIILAIQIGFAQSPERIKTQIGENPIFFIDSIKSTKEDIKKLEIKTVVLVTTYINEPINEQIGEAAKDGIVYIETKDFCKKRYWNFFTSKSEEYKKHFPSPIDDLNVQYILNEQILKDDFEGNLAIIDNTTFKSINIISKENLISKYNILNKDFGVIIEADSRK